PGWGWRSAKRSSKATADGSGWSPHRAGARRFSLRLMKAPLRVRVPPAARFFSGREGKEDRRPLASPRFYPDAPAVLLHDFLADRQPDPRPRIFTARMQALEELKNPPRVLRRDADAVVTHGEHPLPVHPLGGDVHPRRLPAAEFQGVTE